MKHITQKFTRVLAIAGIVSLAAWQAMAMSKEDADLIYNANFGTAEQVRALLAAGANPDATSEDGWPAISLAASRSDEEGVKVTRMLIDAGANLNVRDSNGETPLMNAIMANNPPMVKYMIEHGADFHAMSKGGRNVLGFAKHYAGDDVVFLVSEAIRLEEERIREGKSRRYFLRMMDDYVYYHCALSYLAYNQQTNLYGKERLPVIEQQMEKVKASITNAQTELQYNFHLSANVMKSIGENTQKMMMKELEDMISNRHRLKLGVGTDADLDKRCQKVLDSWRSSFEQYETNAAQTPARR